MLEFVSNPPGTVFKSAVGLLEMAVYEPIILQQTSIDKLDIDLLKAFVWVNLFYTGRIALTIVTTRAINRQYRDLQAKISKPLSMLIIE